jgi:stage V sporulation protein AC
MYILRRFCGMGSSTAGEQERNQRYNEYVSDVTPKNSLFLNCIKAFITGGIICTIGQILTEIFLNMGAAKDDASSYTTICLVFGSILLTGLNIYPLITAWGGAGSLVPITGFANSVVAPAIEYKKEGQVFGIGCKIFTISGPVILYGILSSWILGVIYFVLQLLRNM